MTDIGTLKEIINDGIWLLDQKEDLVERDLASPLLERGAYEVVEVATGVRRAGKSKLILWVGRRLREAGRKVFYINFEDDRFIPDGRDLQKISETLDLKNSVLLIDEPQDMPRWELWVRRMHDRGVKVYVTGSNSRLLGRELSTALGGRKKQHEIFPFSFREYLRARGRLSLPADQKTRELEEYMIYGGYPYPTLSGDRSILGDYRRDITERDILMRHGIRDDSSLRNLVRFLMSNPGLYVSHRTVKGFLDISHVTLRKYLGYIMEAYAVISLEKFSRSEKEKIRNPRKIYPVDNGLLTRKENLGALLEGVVVQHLRRYTDALYYWKDERGREVDVYLPRNRLAVQVVYELNGENLKREERSLESAVKELDASPLVVYLHAEEESRYPMMQATEFLENIETILSTSA
ncbi:MAG: ATP-binding protein [Thermoplasmata archaeon]|nr:ATP-binding protein [Thermoplasmata archaeon]